MSKPLNWNALPPKLVQLADHILKHPPVVPLRQHFMRSSNGRTMFIVGPNEAGMYRAVDIADGRECDIYANGQCFCSDHESIIGAAVTGVRPPLYLIEDLGAHVP